MTLTCCITVWIKVFNTTLPLFIHQTSGFQWCYRCPKFPVDLDHYKRLRTTFSPKNHMKGIHQRHFQATEINKFLVESTSAIFLWSPQLLLMRKQMWCQNILRTAVSHDLRFKTPRQSLRQQGNPIEPPKICRDFPEDPQLRCRLKDPLFPPQLLVLVKKYQK